MNYKRIVYDSLKITDRMYELTGYEKVKVFLSYASFAGGFENWFRFTFLRPSFCIELTHYNGTIPHPDEDFDKLVWEKCRDLGLLLSDN